MLFTVVAAAAHVELEIKRERVTDSAAKRHAAGLNLGGRRQKFTESQLWKAAKLVEGGDPPSHVARDLHLSRAAPYWRLKTLPAQQGRRSET